MSGGEGVRTLTDEQVANGRTAEALRDLAGDINADIEVGRAGVDNEISILWPASNIKDVLHRAADLIEELSLARTPIAGEGVGEVYVAPWTPSEAQWGGLARAIMMWLDMTPKTPRALFRHLESTGEDVPQWLRDEPEMQSLDHVPSKGTRCVIIYRAMLAALSGKREG